MSILIDRGTRVVVQGITGAYGLNQTRRMLEYGTQVGAGVTPGRGGTDALGVPVFDTVKEAVRATGANAGVVYVPAPYARAAVTEGIEAGLKILLVGTEGIPVHESMALKATAREAGTWLVGPNTMGMISPGKCLLGSAMPSATTPGPVGVISRSGTLMGEVCRHLTQGGLGQTTCVGIGGDLVIGNNPVEYLRLFEADPETRAVVLLGEIGGMKEYEAAEFIRDMTKPVVAFIVGRFAPPGKRMGHAGAIIHGERDTAESKCKALAAVGARVAATPWEIVEILHQVLNLRLPWEE